MELELLDEDEHVLYVQLRNIYREVCSNASRYKVGEAFVHIPHAQAMKRLEKDQSSIDAELSQLVEVTSDCEKQMKELKIMLYAKFGRAINLDE